MADEDELLQQERNKILLETAKINFNDLQHFFASGSLLAVDASLDLVDVALQMTLDNVQQIELWKQQHLLHFVTDQQAQSWHQNNTSLWAVVIKPWILVQHKDPAQ